MSQSFGLTGETAERAIGKFEGMMELAADSAVVSAGIQPWGARSVECVCTAVSSVRARLRTE